MQELDNNIKKILNEKIEILECEFGGDCIFYSGPIFPNLDKRFRDVIELLHPKTSDVNRLVFFLYTFGGIVETVEHMVEIMRKHYTEVYFVVPDKAMSAGTILCMSGDKIYMDYSSVLGPIDPQVYNESGGGLVSALGVLEKVNEIIERSAKNKATDAELIFIQNQDLALISEFEHAEKLAIKLVEEWLVKYKFKKLEMANDEKTKKANKIASLLSNNAHWHSHGRRISCNTLKSELELEIEDYSENHELQSKIRQYNDLLLEYIARHEISAFFHHKHYF